MHDAAIHKGLHRKDDRFRTAQPFVDPVYQRGSYRIANHQTACDYCRSNNHRPCYQFVITGKIYPVVLYQIVDIHANSPSLRVRIR